MNRPSSSPPAGELWTSRQRCVTLPLSRVGCAPLLVLVLTNKKLRRPPELFLFPAVRSIPSHPPRYRADDVVATSRFIFLRVLSIADTFGAAVREHRKAKGWTQERLAERARVSALQIGFCERGDNVPKLTLILRIARALGVRPGELIDHIKVS